MIKRIAHRLQARQFGTLVGLVALGAALTVLTPFFFTVSNLVNVVQQSAIIAVVAAGMTFVIISGGIDLSVGSIVALAGLVAADALHSGLPVSVAAIVALLVGLLVGIVNGILITFGKLPPFIATLGTMSAVRGLALMYTGGAPISGFDENFRILATGSPLGIPAPVIVMIAVFIMMHVVLSRTKVGRYTYAIGGNEEGATLSGVNVVFHKTVVYGLCGLLAGLAAILLTARLNSAQPIAGTAYELDAIAAAVIGGTSLLGGEGTLFGTLIGALIMGVLRNGLNLLNVSSYLQQVAIGAVIIVAVYVDLALKRRSRGPGR